MAYIGNDPSNRFVAPKAASVFSGDGSTTAFTLDHAVGSDEDILVSVDGVIQEPSVAYAVSNGTTLTFTAAPSSNSGNNIFVYYLFRTVATVDHPSTSSLQATDGTFSSTLDVTGDATFDTSTLKVDASNNRVGIGTASPSTNLHVSGGVMLDGITVIGRNQTSYASDGAEVLIDANASTPPLICQVGGSTTFSIDGTGAVTKPLQPAFLATKSGNQENFSVGSLQTVTFDTEVFDQNADFASNTFTAPVTGRYHLSFNIRTLQLDSASGYYYTQITTSNRNYINIIDPDFGQDAGHWTFTYSVLADMDASDTAYVGIIQQNGTAQTDVNANSFFSGHLVC